jgi:hypothetical protein
LVCDEFHIRREYCQKEKEHEGIYELQLIAGKQVAYLKNSTSIAPEFSSLWLRLLAEQKSFLGPANAWPNSCHG